MDTKTPTPKPAEDARKYAPRGEGKARSETICWRVTPQEREAYDDAIRVFERHFNMPKGTVTRAGFLQYCVETICSVLGGHLAFATPAERKMLAGLQEHGSYRDPQSGRLLAVVDPEQLAHIWNSVWRVHVEQVERELVETGKAEFEPVLKLITEEVERRHLPIDLVGGSASTN